MALRELFLRLGLRSYERARDLGKEIQVSVRRSVDLSKDAKRELGAAARQKGAQAKALAADAAAGGTLAERSAALRNVEGRVQSAIDSALSKLATFDRFRSLLGLAQRLPTEHGLEATLDIGGAVARLGGPYGQVAASVIELVKGLLTREREETAKAIDARVAIESRARQEALLTTEERLRRDPVFATEEARRAYEAFLGQRAALSASGLSPAAEHIDWGD